MIKGYEQLIGKEVAFFISDATGRRSGYFGRRQGKVVSVDAGPRKGFRSVRVQIGSDTFIQHGWMHPVRVKVQREELSLLNHTTGVVEGSTVVPLAAWFVKNGIERIGGK
jgi:hypothetical protein